jgi:dihydroxy-acid dehydratase
VSEGELQRRRDAWTPPDESLVRRGHKKLFFDHVTQADQGCDFDFLTSRPYVGRTPG